MKAYFKIFALSLGILSANCAYAQKIGVVDTQYIISQLPQYKEAEARLNTQIKTWQDDIKKQQNEYEQKKAAFDSERILLMGEQLIQREKEVKDLEENIKTTLSLRFGTNGEIQKLRSNLLKPFQDQIWEAIRTMADANGLGMVFDKNGDMNVIYLQKRFDYTEKVLDILTKGQKKNNTKK